MTQCFSFNILFSQFIHGAVADLFLQLYGIPLYAFVPFYLFFLDRHLACLIFAVIETLLWIFLYMSPGVNVQMFLLGIYLEVKLLCHRICEFPIVLENAYLSTILICNG